MARTFLRIPCMCLPLLAAATLAAAPEGAPPPTPKKPVSDTYHGIKVADEYRWLENFDDPAVQEWNAAQNRYSRAVLGRIPFRPAVEKRVRELATGLPARYIDLRYRGGRFFARKVQPPREQPVLVLLKSPDEPASERVLVDPVALNPKGTTTIDFYAPSLDGARVAVSLSDRGSEDGTVFVYDVQSGQRLPDVVPRVNGGTAGGSVAWDREGTGFYYTRYPRHGERAARDMSFYQQIWFHKLGTPEKDDTYALGRDFPRIAETVLTTSEDGRHVLAEVENGDGGDVALYLLGPAGPWHKVSAFADGVKAGFFGRDGNLYLLSRQGAPRGKVLRVPLSDPRLAAAHAVVPESDAVIEAVVPAQSRLYVLDLVGGVSQVRVFDLDGQALAPLPLGAAQGVEQVVRLGGDEILYHVQGFTEPPAWYRYAPPAAPVRTALYVRSPVDFSDVEVVRDFATSKDGTRVPLTILVPRGARRDGRNPAFLTGYGGFGVSLTPIFDLGARLWLEQGAIMATANLRGGGEYGEAWHRGGNLTKKQNVFDDFIACAQRLIDQKYTSPQRLAIEGGSNGGLLMGAVVTQRPDLFRAVATYVGLYDMLRFSLYPNGAFNVTEYGSVKDPSQFKALYAYSPYHHVKDGTAYPAMIFLTGENDPRVNPADSRKMVARLQEATSSGLPILLRTSAASGHGGSSLSERIGQDADAASFLFYELGVKYKTPPPLGASASEERGRPAG